MKNGLDNTYKLRLTVTYGQVARHLAIRRERVMGWCEKYAQRIADTENKLRAVKPITWARLAAFIDGEGHVGIAAHRKGGESLGIRVSITSTDPRLPKWLQDNFGGTVCPVPRSNMKSNWKPAIIWAASAKHAELLLQGIRSYLIIKGEQTDIALAFRATVAFGRNLHLTEGEKQHRETLRQCIKKLNSRGMEQQVVQ